MPAPLIGTVVRAVAKKVISNSVKKRGRKRTQKALGKDALKKAEQRKKPEVFKVPRTSEEFRANRKKNLNKIINTRPKGTFTRQRKK